MTILLLAMTFLAIWGVSESVMVTAITTVLGIVGLVAIFDIQRPFVFNTA